MSWSIRSFDGAAVEQCSEAGIRDVRVCWEPLSDAGSTAGEVCQPDHRRRFACGDASGVTGFELEPAVTAFWIEPVCDETGEPPEPDTYQVPPPIVRRVEEGKIVSLNSLLLVVRPRGPDCSVERCTCAQR